MKIVADRAIPFVESCFRTLGEVILCDGRRISASDLRDADVLLVRTVTKVDRALLAGSSIRFVATATSGHDHIDTRYLHESTIGFASAPGCNARSVAEYVLSCLLVLADRDGFDLPAKSVGIIGCGHVGSTVLDMLGILGVNCLIHDPPLQASGSELPFAPLQDVLAADIITLHVPLVIDGEHPTLHLVDDRFLSGLRPDVVLINTSRGEVVDERALSDFINRAQACSVVLDVWQNEPSINTNLVKKVAFSTPHIAGYSLDGKFRGTLMIYEQACQFFNVSFDRKQLPVLSETSRQVVIASEYNQGMDIIRKAVLASYDVRVDDAVLRQILDMPTAAVPAFFSGLRNNYRIRREFMQTTVRLGSATSEIQETLTKLGFMVE